MWQIPFGFCAHAVARLGSIQSAVVLGVDLCRDNHIETIVKFGTGDFSQYVASAPPQSDVLVGSAVDLRAFDNVPRDPGSICAIDYNPLLNPTMPFCKSVSDDPSKWYSDVIAPRLLLSEIGRASCRERV